MHIFDYYKTRLGIAPGDATLRELPLHSACGADCAAAIDAAAELIAQINRASENAVQILAVQAIAENVVSIFWRG